MADRFRHSLRIRYGECDMQGVVFNANYLAYVDDAVDTWVRDRLGSFEELGFDFMLKKATFEWQGPATFGDILDLDLAVCRWGNTSFDVEVVGTAGGKPVITATVVYVSVVPKKNTPTPVPAEVREALFALKPLARDFFRRDAREVAPDLLNKVLVRGSRQGRIVEVEAYMGSHDPASHAYRGPTARNATMFGPPGHLYVYFTYGMHWCANAVCGEEGDGTAVLLRALAPIAGVGAMRTARGGIARESGLCSGPAKLCQAFGIDRRFDGVDLTEATKTAPWLGDDGTAPPAAPGQSTRVGISVAVDREWRWFVRGDANLSRRG